MWKILISFALLVQLFTSTFSQNANSLTKRQLEVQNTTIEEILNDSRVYWNKTMPDKNLQLIPLALFTSRNVMEIRSHYEGAAALYFPKNRLLEIGYSFANLIDTLQDSPNVNLKFKNAIFYDEKSTNKQYLNDVKTRFHAEAYEMSFASNNSESIVAQFNEWFSSITKKPQPKLESPLMSGMNSFHTTVFTFSGCWNKPKISDDIKKTLKFKTPTKEIDIKVLQAKEKIGYYNNPELKYESIRLPFNNQDFAVTIVLPYLNHSLDMDLFRTFKGPDYLELLERVNKNNENIEYSVPLMNSAMITLNGNGTSINKDDPIICDQSSSIRPADRETSYKPFIVDRPFGVILYQEKTKFVLSHVWVRNPTSGVSSFHRYSGKIAYIENNKPKYPLIPTYVVYY
ncbi:uncharacterized protein LOC135842287 [Planococcus citri]|uniref:uncharacterized protein LOC135842287 n=1 Tax=Planococcus citri TaxID=170843 RepID=UPI0031F806A5